MNRNRIAVIAVAVAAVVGWTSTPVSAHGATAVAAPRRTLPDRLSDADYWKLLNDISEPGGYFQIEDNFTSNEPQIGQVFGQLRNAHISGGVYMGVGPEQNLTYIAAVRPQMAFICDIRRQAVIQHLMFKAVFEMAKDRADFIGLLFSKPRPAGLDSTTPIQKIWEAYWPVTTDLTQGPKNYQRVEDQLVKVHHFALTQDELGMLKWVWDAFYQYGPSITTNSANRGRGGGSANTFADLTGYSNDYTGQPQSFLSTEDNYRYVKTLHEKNLIVPVSGDFGGPKAVRAIGAYVKDHGATVSAYYVSNVEQYLFQDNKQAAFYGNVGTIPVTEQSVFIRPTARGSMGGLCPIAAFLRAFDAGRVYGGYNSILACPQ
jgi:hypothetical protein